MLHGTHVISADDFKSTTIQDEVMKLWASL